MHNAPTPLEACRAMLAQVYAAGTDPAALAAAYTAIVGHDPFADDPAADADKVADTLRDFVKEVAASLGVHWAHVDPLHGAAPLTGFLVDEEPAPFPFATMVAANVDAPDVLAWLLHAQPGDAVLFGGGAQASTAVRCIALR